MRVTFWPDEDVRDTSRYTRTCPYVDKVDHYSVFPKRGADMTVSPAIWNLPLPPGQQVSLHLILGYPRFSPMIREPSVHDKDNPQPSVVAQL